METGKQDDDQIARLLKMAHKTSLVTQIVGVLHGVVITVAIFIMMVKIVARKEFKDLPLRVKINLVLYSVYAPALLTSEILLVKSDSIWGYLVYSNPKWRDLEATFITIWFSIHWSFTSNYM